MTTVLQNDHAELISRARAAFGSDPSYAIDIARQATVSLSRRATRTPAPILAQDASDADQG